MHPIRAKFDQYMVPNYAPFQVVPVQGRGAIVTDTEGKEYIDLAGGIAVSALGHCHPPLIEALTNQASTLWHVSNLMTNEPAVKLAELLCNETFAERVFFSNSGAEANEACLKLARRYAYDTYGAHKNRIIAFDNAFHGRTLFTVSVGGQPKYQEGFGPCPEGIDHVPYNDLEALTQAMGDDVCAIMVEPVQGEGGMTPATQAFLEHCRQLCDQHGALLIFDEVQSGIGRSGQLYAYQHYGVIPDILSSAKALGCGFPMGAMLTRAEIAKVLTPGTHGTTSGGNPLACAVGYAAVHEICQPEFLAQVRSNTEFMRQELIAIGERTGTFSEVRGLGLWFGCQLTAEHAGQAITILSRALELGVMVLVAGADVIRLAPALNTDRQTLAQGLAKLETALTM